MTKEFTVAATVTLENPRYCNGCPLHDFKNCSCNLTDTKLDFDMQHPYLWDLRPENCLLVEKENE